MNEAGYEIFTPGTTSRGFLEGFALSRWTAHGARGSGVPTNGVAPIMIVGDSFVEARQVEDAELISARLQETLCSNSIPNGVISLGHSGDSMAEYVRDAPLVQGWFQPTWTVVVLDRGDFSEAMDPARSAHFVQEGASGGELVLKTRPPHRAMAGRLGALYYGLLNHSSLCKLAWIRTHALLKWWKTEPPLFNASTHATAPKGGEPPPRPPTGAQLQALKNAYHGRLTILYRSPDCAPGARACQEPLDLQVEQEARALGISFVSLADSYPAALARGEMPTGFPNTAPFVGHWNRVGHRIAAEAVAPELIRLHKEHGLF